MRNIEFVRYTGKYPNLCSGDLVLNIDNKEYIFTDCMCSGGYTSFNEDWSDEFIAKGPWNLDFKKMTRISGLDFTISETSFLKNLVNVNVPWGCCGGCL